MSMYFKLGVFTTFEPRCVDHLLMRLGGKDKSICGQVYASLSSYLVHK